MIKVLIADDSALMRRLLGNIFRSEGDFQVDIARDGIEALAKVHEFEPDVVTLDIHMPKMDGLACLGRIMIERPTRVIMVSALTAEGADETFEAMQLGAVDFVTKPDGAVSLAVGDLASILIEKTRTALKARLRTTRHLVERVRLQSRQVLEARSPASRASSPSPLGQSAVERAGPAGGIVLVGASTGGPPALDALLSPLPADFPWPIVIAQHMPATFTGPLARRLDRMCAVSVREVVQAEELMPGCAYVGKGDADMIVVMRGGRVCVTAAPSLATYRWHPSVDRLVTSAMQHISPKRLVGILMTGMGNDGAQAMAQLLQQGGRTIAEAEETAVVWGMPGELVKLNGAELVAPLGNISSHLLDWAR